jgi:hypothetical protein
MTVQEVVQLVVTSGIATEHPESGEYRDFSEDELEELDVPGPGAGGGGDGDGDGDRDAGSGTGTDD